MNVSLTSSPVRVRMAPSPTGYLHIGGLRTTLFNVLFAQHNKGQFLIRIEDTDTERSTDEYTQSILDAFSWCNITSDEPIVIQSQRIARHTEVIKKLLAEGKAYKCYCSPDQLKDRLGAGAMQEGSYTRYDGHCKAIMPKNDPCAIRFAIPEHRESVTFNDLIHGEITFKKEQLDDFIIMRSDGTPMYNFVVVVDDADMGITQVIRGDDHISNTPKQILLYEACGFAVPQFAHLPMILAPDGKRLSKRYAATAVFDYKKQGFLAEALCNYLIRLGWSHGDQEIFTHEELVSYFSLDQVGKKAAIFDMKKLEWMNGVYIRNTSVQKLLEFIRRDIDQNFGTDISDTEQLLAVIELYKERAVTLVDLIEQISCFYQPAAYQSADVELYKNEQTKEILHKLYAVLDSEADFNITRITEVIKNFCNEQSIGLAVVGKPLRIALTGKTMSPGIFELLALLGKRESLGRLKHFSDALA